MDFQINMTSCSASLEELFFSKSNFEKLNVLKLFYYIVSDIFVTSDTSSTGLASFVVHQKKKFICHKNLRITEEKQSPPIEN